MKQIKEHQRSQKSQSQGSLKGKGKSKSSRGKTKSKGQGQWTAWPGISSSWSWQGQNQGAKEKEKATKYALAVVVKVTHGISAGGLPNQDLQDETQILKRRVHNIAAQPTDYSVAFTPTDPLRRSQDLRPLHQRNQIFNTHSHHRQQRPRSSTLAKVGFSGHQLRINHFTSGVSDDYIIEVNLSSTIHNTGLSRLRRIQQPGLHPSTQEL